jgi:hypothetical protein
MASVRLRRRCTAARAEHAQEAPMLLAALPFEHAHAHRYSCAPQSPCAPSPDGGMRVRMSCIDAREARRHDALAAGSGAPLVSAGLERDRQRRPAQRACAVATRRPLDRHDLGVSATRRARAPPTEHAIAAVHDRTHRRVGMGATAGGTSLRERHPHRLLRAHSDGS